MIFSIKKTLGVSLAAIALVCLIPSVSRADTRIKTDMVNKTPFPKSCYRADYKMEFGRNKAGEQVTIRDKSGEKTYTLDDHGRLRLHRDLKAFTIDQNRFRVSQKVTADPEFNVKVYRDGTFIDRKGDTHTRSFHIHAKYHYGHSYADDRYPQGIDVYDFLPPRPIVSAESKSITWSAAWVRAKNGPVEVDKYKVYRKSGKKWKYIKTVKAKFDQFYTMNTPNKTHKYRVDGIRKGKTVARSHVITAEGKVSKYGNKAVRTDVNGIITGFVPGVKVSTHPRLVGPKKARGSYQCWSSDPSVAKVTKKGVIKAVSGGSAAIFIQSPSGSFKMIPVYVWDNVKDWQQNGIARPVK